MNTNSASHKSPVFKDVLRTPSPSLVRLLNNLHTDDCDLLARLMLKVILHYGQIPSGASGQDVPSPLTVARTPKARAVRERLEKELLVARRTNPFTGGGAFKPRQTGNAVAASPRWLPRFQRLESELRAALKRLPGYSRLCVCKRNGCWKFFIRKTARHRDYCSRRCAGASSAQVTMQRKRDAKRAILLKRVRAALKSCPSGRDAKKWAAKRAKVTANWITYAAARGEVRL